MDEKVMELSAQFMMHLDYSVQKSALVHFLGVLGYDSRTRRWREANTYTPILAGIQFCMRILMLEYGLPSEERDGFFNIYGEDGDPLAVFRQVRDKWLTEGEASPFNTMHKLLQYGMQVGGLAGGRERVMWSEDRQMMYFDGRPLKVEEVRGFIHGIIEAAEEVLCEKLLFGGEERLKRMDLGKIKDEVNNPNLGHTFVKDPDNGMVGGRERMMELLKKSGAWDKMMTVEPNDLWFNPRGMKEYEKDVKRFLEYLLILVHITGANLEGEQRSRLYGMPTRYKL